jgi:hemerythrin-like domain-containing protein
MTKCVTDYLVHEHQELSHLMNELQEQLGALPLTREPVNTAERLNGLTRAIAHNLHAHVVKEEQILYPALEDHVQGIAATLQRMRDEHDAGEKTENTYHQCLARLLKGERNRREVMQSGRQYIQWLRSHLLDENGRLFPMVERNLDLETQQEVRRAMEELSGASQSRIAEVIPRAAHA